MTPARRRAPGSGPESEPEESAEPADYPEVGPTLRKLRDERSLSLERLAERAGVSRAMLSQIELGQSVPTIRTLWRIARSLELPFSALMVENPPRSTVVLRGARARVLASADGRFRSRALFPLDAPRRAELYELRLAARSEENAEAHATGTTENLVVTQGEVEIEVRGERHVLETGDAIVFEADLEHTYRNRGAKEAVMYLVMTYAHQRSSGAGAP